MKPFMLIATVVATLVPALAQADMKESQLRQLQKEIVEKEWPACIEPRNYYDKVYCSSKVYNLLDTALNTAYVALRKELTDEQKNALKDVQLTWLRERDDTCAKLENNMIIMNLNCSTAKTVESLYYINQMQQNPADFALLLQEYKDKK